MATSGDKPRRSRRLLKREQPLVEHEEIEDKRHCPEHEGEAIAYHCPTHSFLGCHTCSFHHQKTCREVKYIPEISETITNSTVFKEFMTKLNNTAGMSNNLVDECKRNITLVEMYHTDAIAAINAFRLELLEAIDKLEKGLYEKIELIKQKSLCRLKYAVDFEKEMKTMATEMEVLQIKNRENDLYIAMVESKDKLLSLEAELIAAKSENVVKPFKFQVNTELRESLRSTSGFGKLITSEVVKAERAKDINVKLTHDKIACQITGSVVMPDHKLILADTNNKNVKVIDTRQQIVLSSMILSSWPWSLAKVTDNTVAATLPNEKKIVLFRTDPELSIDTDLEVDGACYGVAYNDGKLVVGFYSPHKVEIMDVKGSVLHRIETDDSGQALFNRPYYVAINPEGSLIYVSNHWSHSVVCLRFDGTVVATYKDDNDLKSPLQVIVDSTGKVYVCGFESHNIHQITEDCKKTKVIMTSADGLGRPYTLSYEETEGKLYVGQGNTDNMKVYRMIYDSL